MKQLLKICAGLFVWIAANNTAIAVQDTLPGLQLCRFDVDATPPPGSRLVYDSMINNWDQNLRAKGVILTGAGKNVLSNTSLPPKKKDPTCL